MTKAQIVDRIAGATGLTRIETDAVVDGFLLTVVDAVAAGHAVELRGFGTFRSRVRAPRAGRNPRTGEPSLSPGGTVPAFKPAERFRQRVADAGAVKAPLIGGGGTDDAAQAG